VAGVLEIIPHASGPWLVRAGGSCYALPPRLGRALRPLGGRIPDSREIADCLAEAGTEGDPDARALAGHLVQALGADSSRPGGRPIRWRVPLVPARVVRKVAAKTSFLTGPGALGVLTLIGLAGYLTGTAGSGRPGFSWDLGTAAAGLGLFLLSALWHELGHAAAVARGGYPPGGIGAGLLFVIPVLFADVSAVGAMPRSDRIRVDMSGVVFQLALGSVYLALAGMTGNRFLSSALVFAGSSALFAVTWSLLPFVRSDGYWLLCDLLGLDDLDRPPRQPVSRLLRVFLVLFQLTNAVFLIFIGVFFPARMTGLLLALIPQFGFRLDPKATVWLSWGCGLVFLGAAGIGITRRVAVLVRSAWWVARNKTQFNR